MSKKIIACHTNPFADPDRDTPAFNVSRADAEDRVSNLGIAYWVDERTIQYVSREQRSREELVAAGTFREAWKQKPSGPTRIPVWQLQTERA